ncbi:MAG TPA: hypothetical protein VEM41_10920 [Actinomycetota bacterium]|nr:hypothetical protein [Actinomycetota bacterium]
MHEARCPSCGTKVQVPEGQPLPRCKHCWSPLEAVTGGSSPAARATSRTGLDALFEQYAEEAGAPEQSENAAAPPCCQWCGAISEPGLFCSDCGSPLLEVV